MKLDKSQEEAKRNIINSVVSAGAGSGKTRVLAERFAYLVTEKHYKVDEILTLTFTKKATVEMKGRIFTTLKKSADEGNEFSKEAVLNFNNAQIMTLDSYFSYIARQGSRFYGITPSFTTDKNEASKQIKDMAVPFLLENRDNSAIREASEILNNYEELVTQLFVAPVTENSHPSCPVDFKGDFRRQAKTISIEWDKINSEIDKCLDDIRNNFSPNNPTAGYAVNINGALENRTRAGEMPSLSEEDIMNGNLNKVESHIEQIYLPWLNMNKPQKRYVGELIEHLYLQLMNKIYMAFKMLNFISSIETTKSAVDLLEKFQDKVLAAKRTSAILTHGDVSQMACDILINHPEIRAVEKNRFRAIMIDEFQDNNSLQRDILYMLAEVKERNEKGVPDPMKGEIYPDKLFFVGDEKQSIYKFRGADVSVFNDLKETIKNSGGKNLYMETNYRSDPELIAGFNTLFGGASYPPVENEEPTDRASMFLKKNADGSTSGIPAFEAAYGTVYPNKDRLSSADYNKKRIHISLTEHASAEDKRNAFENGIDLLQDEETEAYSIAAKISNLIASGKYKPSDIAILFRRNTHLSHYERALLQYGIPYSTETRKGFFTDGPVNDIFSMINTAVYPEDVNYYAKLLCSPFVNLSIREASSVIAKSTVPFDEEAENILEGKSRENFHAAKEFFTEFEKSVKEAPVTDSLTKVWKETGYKYETMWNSKVRMFRPTYDILYEIARQCDLNGMGIAAFIDTVKVYQDDKSKITELDVPFEAKDFVNIMTIHKSKGLEFKVVFVVGTNGEGKDPNEYKIMLYFTKKDGVCFKTKDYTKLYNRIERAESKKNLGGNYFYLKAKEMDEKLECAELRRLGYVAFTRAVEELYISGKKSGFIPKNRENYTPDKYSSTSILQQLTPVMLEHMDATQDPEDENNIIYTAKENSPFDFEIIPKMDRSSVQLAISQLRKSGEVENSISKKSEIAEKISGENNSKNIIPFDIPELPYISPSKLHSEDDETISRDKKYTGNKNAPYQEINMLIEKSQAMADKKEDGLPVFSVTDFGTIAHAYLEARINGVEPFIKESLVSGLREIKGDKEKLFAICREMAEKFAQSEIGMEAMSSEWKRAEYEFKSRYQGKIASGSIDLAFKNPKEGKYKYTVVDYKTNQTIEPEIYREQLECYRHALSKIWQINPQEIRCVLYYLRFHKAVEL